MLSGFNSADDAHTIRNGLLLRFISSTIRRQYVFVRKRSWGFWQDLSGSFAFFSSDPVKIHTWSHHLISSSDFYLLFSFTPLLSPGAISAFILCFLSNTCVVLCECVCVLSVEECPACGWLWTPVVQVQGTTTNLRGFSHWIQRHKCIKDTPPSPPCSSRGIG